MNRREKLTALVLCGNCISTIENCLISLQWADDIFVVVDSGSSDGSAEICKKYAKRVEIRTFVNPRSQKQWALDQIGSGWVLFVDSDEYIPEGLAMEIRDVVNENHGKSGFRIRRKNIYLGKPVRFGGWHHEHPVRLAKAEKAKFAKTRVHERILVDGDVGILKGSIIHKMNDDLNTHINKLLRYSIWGALDLFERGRNPRLWDILLKPPARFLRMYILQLGFLEGIRGIHMATISTIGVYLKYFRLWQLWMQLKKSGNRSEIIRRYEEIASS